MKRILVYIAVFDCLRLPVLYDLLSKIGKSNKNFRIRKEDFFSKFAEKKSFSSTAKHDIRRRPYRDEYTGSLSNSEVNRRRARSVLPWGTGWEDLWVLPAFLSLGVWGPLFFGIGRGMSGSRLATDGLFFPNLAVFSAQKTEVRYFSESAGECPGRVWRLTKIFFGPKIAIPRKGLFSAESGFFFGVSAAKSAPAHTFAPHARLAVGWAK